MCLYVQFDSSWFEVHVVGFLSKYFNAFKAYILLLLMFYIILTRVGCGCGLYMLPTFHFNLTYTQGCKIPLARSHWRVNIDGGRVKLAMRSPDRASVFSSSEFVIFQSFGRKNGKTPT